MNRHIATDHKLKIWGEDGCLLVCSAVQSGRSLPTFQRSLLPLSSGIIALMIDAVEDSHIRTHRHENLKSY
jgi:hypothetical protein